MPVVAAQRAYANVVLPRMQVRHNGFQIHLRLGHVTAVPASFRCRERLYAYQSVHAMLPMISSLLIMIIGHSSLSLATNGCVLMAGLIRGVYTCFKESVQDSASHVQHYPVCLRDCNLPRITPCLKLCLHTQNEQ